MSNVGKMSQVLNAYPVGSIYMSVNSTNPGELFGGTWEQIQGRFLLGQGSGYSAGTVGGEASHALSDNEMPSHRHWITSAAYDDGNGSGTGGNSQYYGLWADAGGYSADDSWGNYGRYSAWAGGNGSGQAHRDVVAHNNMPPYLVVYIWKRTA